MDARAQPTEGSFTVFVRDLRRAVAICRRWPWLVVIEVGLGVLLASSNRLFAQLPEDPTVALVAFLGTASAAASIGWLGAQRMAFRAAMLGEPFGLGEVGRAIRRQGWRFVKLGLLLLPVAAVILAIMVVSVDDLTAEAPTISTFGQLLIALVAIAMGIALTLVTPSLALEDVTAREAWARGVARLRGNFAEVRWHAIIPPLLLVAVPAVPGLLGGHPGWGPTATLLLTSSMLLARGAVVAAHLRIVERESA